MNFKNKGTSALPTASLNKSFRAIFVLILSMFTFSFFSCDGGLFDSSDGIVIKAYDADSWTDGGNRYPGMGRSIFRSPSDSGNEAYTYKISLSRGKQIYTKTVGGGTIVVMDNIPVGPWKITCRAYKSDGTLEYMGSTDAEVIENKTVTASIELRKCPVVTFMDGETVIASQAIEFGGRVTKPENPTKEEFTFVSWYKDTDTGIEFDFSTEINEDITLYARWSYAGIFQGTQYIELPEGTDGTAGTEWTYVLFGDWPQTIKRNTVEVDETKSVVVGMFTYYKGDDNAWYVKIKENSFGTHNYYSDGSEVANASVNSYKYFKVEPIKWRLITENYSGNKLLLAEDVLVNCPHYDYNEIDREGSVYPNNYKESRIRAYLNGLSYNIKPSDDSPQTVNNEFNGRGFFQTAFTEPLHSYIADTTVDNSTVSTYEASSSSQPSNSNACENTIDKVFLLSMKEITTSEYGFDSADVYVGDSNGTTSSARIHVTTDFAKGNGTTTTTWMLRSPKGAYKYYAILVDNKGEVGSYNDVASTGRAVCPALCVNP